MKIYFNIDENNRLDGWSSNEKDGAYSLEVPNNHEVVNSPYHFRYENGQLVKDVEYQQQEINDKKKRLQVPSLEQEVDSLKRQNSDLAYMLMVKGVL